MQVLFCCSTIYLLCRYNHLAQPGVSKIFRYLHVSQCVPKSFSLTRKLRVLAFARTTENIKRTARKFKAQTSQMCQWRITQAQIEALAKENPTSQTLHKGNAPENPASEQSVLDWVLDTRAKDSCVTTEDIIFKAIAFCPSFEIDDVAKMHS